MAVPDLQKVQSKSGPSPDAAFLAHVANLMAAAGNLGAAPVGGFQRRWAPLPTPPPLPPLPPPFPPLPPAEAPFTLDPLGLSAVFDRSGIDEKYVAIYKDALNPGVTGDAVALQLQSAFIAARERARRLRHSSSVRSAAHATGRSIGQGDPAGIYGNGILRHVQDIITQSATA